MTGSFAAKFSSTNANKNVVVPGEKVSFTFTSPPKEASQVLVTVRQSVSFLTGRADITDEPIGEPPERIRAYWQQNGLSEERLWLLDVGETRRL